MSARPTELTESLHDYVLANGFREPDVLARLRAETESHEWAIMQISPEQGAFMALLTELIGAQSYLEVGVFTGYSSLAVALAMPPDGRVTALDRNDEWTRTARRYWEEAGVADRIELRLGDACETMAALLDEGRGESYDFAFIDADKADYDDYYEYCLRLVRPGGLIGLDNVFHMGNVAEPAKWTESTPVIDALNKKIKADERVTPVIIAIGDGLTLCRKRE